MRKALSNSRWRAVPWAVLAAVLLLPVPAFAKATAQEFLKAMSDNVDERPDSGKVIAVVCGAAGVVLLLVVISRRQKRQVVPQPVNHPGKLMKEVLKRVPIKGGDVRRIKALADARQCSPLTVLLCPSIAQKQVRKPK